MDTTSNCCERLYNSTPHKLRDSSIENHSIRIICWVDISPSWYHDKLSYPILHQAFCSEGLIWLQNCKNVVCEKLHDGNSDPELCCNEVIVLWSECNLTVTVSPWRFTRHLGRQKILTSSPWKTHELWHRLPHTLSKTRFYESNILAILKLQMPFYYPCKYLQSTTYSRSRIVSYWYTSKVAVHLLKDYLVNFNSCRQLDIVIQINVIRKVAVLSHFSLGCHMWYLQSLYVYWIASPVLVWTISLNFHFVETTNVAVVPIFYRAQCMSFSPVS